MITIPMKVQTSTTCIPVTVSADKVELKTSLNVGYHLVESQKYKGGYRFIPSENEQVVQTANRVLLDNIVIAPIPSNWGRISYNGSYLTVS